MTAGPECPFCGLRVPDEQRHMEAFHRDVIEARLRAIGEPLEPESFPERMKRLAEDLVRYRRELAHDPDWCREMCDAVRVEMDAAIAREMA